MKIINATKQTLIADKATPTKTPIKRLIGLIGRREFKPDEALVIRPCSSIHTFFMHFAIDVLFVDKHNRVIVAIKRLKPWRLSGIYFFSRLCIELPLGSIESSHTSKGDLLNFTL